MIKFKVNKNLIKLILVLIFISIIGFLIVNENYSTKIYDFTFNTTYILIIFLLLPLAFIIILFEEKPKIDKVKEKLLKISYFIVFSPLAFYAIFRCYFKIPYVFCHACPRKCIFGHLRPSFVPAVLLLNIDKRTWCYNYCPIGFLQETLSKLTKKKIILPKFLSYFKYVVLLFVVFTYFIILNNIKNPSLTGYDLYTYTFKNIFSFSLNVLIIAIIILIISFFVYRFWCNYFCPIGTVSDLILKIEKKFNK